MMFLLLLLASLLLNRMVLWMSQRGKIQVALLFVSG
jgi:hypothetical protein